jgi:hypothetical protein
MLISNLKKNMLNIRPSIEQVSVVIKKFCVGGEFQDGG